tara:strand:+ start:3251 stop:3451 length:201 start_codon:yes stop_codon:yes gene_type:complete
MNPTEPLTFTLALLALLVAIGVFTINVVTSHPLGLWIILRDSLTIVVTLLLLGAGLFLALGLCATG